MMSGRDPASWQLILADLSLILFLVATTALVQQAEDHDTQPRTPAAAPAQAIYRPGAGTPEFSAWLEAQALDPRISASIVATYLSGAEDQAWQNARALADQARATGLETRIVMREGERADLYASLAYDRGQ